MIGTITGSVARFRVDSNPKVGNMSAVDMPIFDYVLAQLVQSKGLLPRIAQESGVPYRTLQKIANGEIRDPGVSTIQKLYDYFRQRAVA